MLVVLLLYVSILHRVSVDILGNLALVKTQYVVLCYQAVSGIKVDWSVN